MREGMKSNKAKKHINVAAQLMAFFTQAIRQRQQHLGGLIESGAIPDPYRSMRPHDGSKPGARHHHNPAGTKLARMAASQAITIQHGNRRAW